MPKLIATLLLLLPLTASAECGLVRDGVNMTIVVGKEPGKCLASGEFRENFKANVLALNDEVEVKEKKAFDDRNSRASKLWTIAERMHQSSSAGGRYFGQRH